MSHQVAIFLALAWVLLSIPLALLIGWLANRDKPTDQPY